MKRWLLLSAAIAAEAFATLSLRAAVDNPLWTVAAVAGYVLAYALIGLTLRTGMTIGAVYGIWGAAGVALVATFGVVIFGEFLSPLMVIGLVLIIVGVILVETGSRPDPHSRGTVHTEVDA